MCGGRDIISMPTPEDLFFTLSGGVIFFKSDHPHINNWNYMKNLRIQSYCQELSSCCFVYISI